MAARFIQIILVVSIFALAVLLRISNYEFVFQDIVGHLNFYDTDAYYYLRRLVYFVQNFPDPMLFDPLSDWPSGAPVDWPEGFLWLVGVPLKLLGVSSFFGVELGAIIICVLLGLVFCWLIYQLSRSLIKEPSWQLAALFFAATNFLIIRFSSLGGVDHHIVEAMLAPLVIILGNKVFSEGQEKWSFALGALLGFGLLVSPSSLFVIGSFFLAYIFVYRLRSEWRPLWLSLGSLLLVLVPYVVWNHLWLDGMNSFTRPSFFHLGLVSGLAVVSVLIRQFPKRAFGVALGGLLLTSLYVVLGLPYGHLIIAALQYVFAKSDILGAVNEAKAIYIVNDQFDLSYVVLHMGYLFPVVLGMPVFLLRWKSLTSEERVLLVFGLALLIPCIAQKRFVQLFVGVYLVYLSWCCSMLVSWIRSRGIRVDWAVSGLLVALMILPNFQYGFTLSVTPRHHVDVPITKHFMDKISVDRQEAWERLTGEREVKEAVWANPNLGHMLSYLTGYGVISNSFYHYHGIDLDRRLRLIEDMEDFKHELEANRIRYLILVDDFRLFQYYLQSFDPELESRFFSKTTGRDGKPADIYKMDELEKLASIRLMVKGTESKSFSQLFVTKFKVPYYYSFVRALEFKGAMD